MRKAISVFLRKLADFIDPRVGPSEVATIRIEADISQAQASIVELDRYLRPLVEMLDRASVCSKTVAGWK